MFYSCHEELHRRLMSDSAEDWEVREKVKRLRHIRFRAFVILSTSARGNPVTALKKKKQTTTTF